MNRLALQVVCVVSAVSTALAAPTLLPPSEALSGLEEPSNAPLHRFQTDGVSASGLDVGEPRATTVLVNSVVGSDELFDETRPFPSGEESPDVLLHQFQIDGFPAVGLNVHEPQVASVLASSVAGSNGFFDKTRNLPDSADAPDHDSQSAATDVPHPNHVGLNLGRRADNPPGRFIHPEEMQALVNTNFKLYEEQKAKAELYHSALTATPRSAWVKRSNVRQIKLAMSIDESALGFLKSAYKYGSYRTVAAGSSVPLPSYEGEERRVRDKETQYRQLIGSAMDEDESEKSTGGNVLR
ncbi:hypothetical protein EV361DRAFT_923232 [Lentinula raphanica]|nr:hypothetical protein F5880DRAFT_1510381 [Lentinula raphanica]KAJ3968965.1 hypothetical protein EV361DRAFT_923232 [Lentinula raphanica]